MALKLNRESVRTENKKKFSVQILAIIGLICIIGGIILINYWTSAPMRDVVSVAAFKNDVAQNTYITKDMIREIKMVTADYEQYAYVKMQDGTNRRQIVLYDDIKDIVGKYTANFVRRNTGIFYDSVTTESTKSTSYLYQMDGMELLKLEVDPKQFGDIVVPGDRLNIRITYSRTKYDMMSLDEYLQVDGKGADAEYEDVTELLFSEVTDLDMLNKRGESIFDKYYNLISLPESKRKAAYEDKSFKEGIEPKSVLIAVTAEEAERYSYLNKNIKSSIVTLLPRTTPNVILNAIDELSKGTSTK